MSRTTDLSVAVQLIGALKAIAQNHHDVTDNGGANWAMRLSADLKELEENFKKGLGQ